MEQVYWLLIMKFQKLMMQKLQEEFWSSNRHDDCKQLQPHHNSKINQENNVRNSKISGSSTQPADNSLLGHTQQIEPNTEPKDEDSDEEDIIIEDNGVPQKIPKAALSTESLGMVNTNRTNSVMSLDRTVLFLLMK